MKEKMFFKKDALRKIIIVVCALCWTFSLYAQKTITGTVTDVNDEPIAGASVFVKSTTSGVVTDMNGTYRLNVPENATLVFSYVGYIPQEITVTDQTTVSVKLAEEMQSMDEVVIVGYGTQRKVTLTGSVATISPSEIQEIPASNLSNALSGRLPGVYIYQSMGGRPGNSSSLNIRSTSSWNGGSPLYVIDGVIRDKFAFDGLDASDVESLSILKDGASTAIYGSRASNGVVLVSTKKGRIGKPVISYSGSVGVTELTTIPPVQNAYNHATYINDALTVAGFDSNDMRWYADDELEYFKNHSYDWLELAWKTPVITQHSLNVSGGNNQVRYFIGGNYYYETGGFENMKFDKYSLRGNIEANITKNLIASLNLNTDFRDDLKPYWRNDNGNDALHDLFGCFLRFSPSFIPPYVDGKPVGRSDIANLHVFETVSPRSGYIKRKYNNIEANISLQYNVPFVEGLSLKALYNSYTRQTFHKEMNVPYILYELKTTGTHGHIFLEELSGATYQPVSNNYLREQYDRNNSYQFNAFVNYDRKFGAHEINAVFTYEQSEGMNDWFYARANNFVSTSVDQLGAGSRSQSDFDLNGNGSETGRQSVAGRVHYGYADKYLVDIAFRSDGSVLFAPEYRWGFFPSIGVSWRISEESFFKDNISFINNLKIRASVAKTGNDAVGGWQWMQRFRLVGGSTYGSTSRGLQEDVIPNPFITWEKTRHYDAGLDASFFNNRLNFAFSVFSKHTYDILGSRNNILPSTFGGNMPAENYGKMDAKGYEVELGYTDNIGNVTYRVGGNLGYAVNKYVLIDEAENLPEYRSVKGLNNDRRRGFVYTDIIRTQADLDALPEGYTIRGATPQLGMLNYKDIRGVDSDTPDGKITDEDQEWIITHNTPPVKYGFYVGAEWKGFELDLFFQGATGHKIMENQRLSVMNPRTKNFDVFTDHWTPNNVNASFPRAEISGWNTYPESSFWVYNGSYMRLKNLSLSYALPKTVLSKLHVNQLKIFFTGTNLLLLEDHVKIFDPELGDSQNPDNIRMYPMTKSYSFGINLSF
jgi:TonB-linked SusC/RagA family outer membrane protein